MGDGTAARFGGARRELGDFAELFALCGLAVVQPTLDLLGRNARLLIAWQASTVQIVLMTLLLVVVPPLVFWVVEVAVGLIAPRARPVAHAVLLGLVAGVLATTVLKRATGGSPTVVVPIAVVVAAGCAILVLRFGPVRTWLRFLAIAPVAFVALFLFASPAAPIVFAQEPAVRTAQVAHPHRVVMVVFDEFPVESLLDGSARIDAGRYPNFAALADGSTWYRNDTTVAPYTEAAVPAILTGQMPSDPDAVPATASYPDNLFTLLGGTYRLNVHESVTRLCPAGLCPPARRLVGVHPGFGGMLGDVATLWGDVVTPSASDRRFAAGIGGEDLHSLEAAEEFVPTIRADDRPTLDFVHVLLPHFPWHYLPGGRDYATYPSLPVGLDERGVWKDQEFATSTRTRHLLQVAAADHFLGLLVERMRAAGVWDDSVLVVTSDHGVAFRAGRPFRGVARDTYPSVMWTPLFVKYPHQAAGGVDDRPARSVDVLPTVARTLGVRVPWRVDGRALTATPRRPGSVPLFEWSSNAAQPSAGESYLSFDGVAGFRRVLAAHPVPGAGADPLRPYRRGPFGDLVGESAWDRAVLGLDAGTGTIEAPLTYQVVDHDARLTPWAKVVGTAAVPDGSHLVLAANGRVAGVYRVRRPPGAAVGTYGGMVAPILSDGNNLMQLFLVTGPPDAPVLRGLRVES